MKRSIMLLLCCFCFYISNAQDLEPRLSLRFGATQSDMNYGSEFIPNLLTPENQGYSVGGSSGYGYYVGLGSSIKLTPGIGVFFNADYSKQLYMVDGNVFDPVQPGPNDIIAVDGKVHYSFVSLETGLKFYLKGKVLSGLHADLLVNHLIYTNTRHQLEVTYGNEDKLDFSDFPVENEPNYNNIWMAGIGLGYDFKINEKLSITTSANIRFGLNGIVDEAPEPATFNFGVSLNRAF